MKKPNEKKRILQKHQDPDRLPAPSGRLLPEGTLPEPSVVDVRVWYELVGQKVLESQITDLNTNGHTKLTIKENRDIVVNRQKKEMLKGTLDSFPAKSYWEELVLLLAEDELKGKITGNTLQVSWI